jgi:hypothetical protein
VSTREGDAFQRHQRAKRKICGWSLAEGSGTPAALAAPTAQQKGTILEGEVGQAGTASNIKEDGGVSSGLRVWSLFADPMQTSHLQGKYLGTSEAAIMMGMDTKKMYRSP